MNNTFTVSVRRQLTDQTFALLEVFRTHTYALASGWLMRDGSIEAMLRRMEHQGWIKLQHNEDGSVSLTEEDYKLSLKVEINDESKRIYLGEKEKVAIDVLVPVRTIASLKRL